MAAYKIQRVDGTNNPFAGAFGDQCTYWAQQRYHDLTGIWTPCTGNGYQWASEAAANGWLVSSQPPASQPSIICLQPGVQGANVSFGHVGIIERINSDGTVYTSNYNVYPHVGDKVVVYVTFHTGSGVSFIYAQQGAGNLNPLSGIVNNAKNTLGTIGQTFSLSSNASVSDTLIALDSMMNISNPFDNISATQDSVAGLSFTDPISWIEGLSVNFVNDLIALIMRAMLLAIGIFIFFRIFDHFINFSSAAQNIGQAVEKLAPLLLAG